MRNNRFEWDEETARRNLLKHGVSFEEAALAFDDQNAHVGPARQSSMEKVITSGKRYLKDDKWHDDNGPLPGHPGLWDPPMTDEEIEIAALSDPDAQPRTPEQLARGRRISFAKHVRFKLGLSQEQFAERFGIPIGTLRDWEQHRTEPDTAAMSYLKVIKANPKAVTKALETA